MKYKDAKEDENYYQLRDISRNLEYGEIKADKRIQVKMPTAIVEALDTKFPELNRSKLLTKLAIQALLDRDLEDPNDGWASFADMEAAANEDLLNYLEKREN